MDVIYLAIIGLAVLGVGVPVGWLFWQFLAPVYRAGGGYRGD